MENNNQPVQPAKPANQEVPGEQPTLTTVQQEQNQEGNKMILWLVGGLILIVLVVGGIYWFLSKQQENKQVSQAPAKPVETQITTDSLNQDLNSVDTESSDSGGFTQVDQDLQGL